MSADLVAAIGVLGVLTGVSALAVARAKAARKPSWLEEMEAKRQSEKLGPSR